MASQKDGFSRTVSLARVVFGPINTQNEDFCQDRRAMNIGKTPKADVFYRMAADHPQSEVVQALSEAQLRTVRLLLVFGADPNTQAAVSGVEIALLRANSNAMLKRTNSPRQARDKHRKSRGKEMCFSQGARLCISLLAPALRPWYSCCFATAERSKAATVMARQR